MLNFTLPLRLWGGNFYENCTVGDNGRAVLGDVTDVYNISAKSREPSFFNVVDYEKLKGRNTERVKGTCNWVLQAQIFSDWLERSQGSLLWVTAYPGCCKSVLSKALVDEKIALADGGVTLYFFFRERWKQRMVTTALCAMLHQLFKFRPQLFKKHAELALNEGGERIRFEFHALWTLFLKAVTDPEAGQVTCVLDGFDECELEDRWNLLDQLKETYSSRSSKSSEELKLRFFITSRPYSDLEARLGQFSEAYLYRIRDEDCTKQISEDVNRVAKKRIKDVGRDQGFNAKLEKRILKRLLQNPQRTYLWITVVCEWMTKVTHFGEDAWLSAVDKLPKTVDLCYETYLSECNDPRAASTILSLVVFAKRPLTLQELETAIAVQEGKLRNGNLLGEKAMERYVRKLCGFLLSISDSTIYPFHQTIKQFLIRPESGDAQSFRNKWKHSLDRNECHRKMAEVCMRYLLSEDLQDERGDSSNHLYYPKGRDDLPRKTNNDDTYEPEEEGFFGYAATYWAEHYSKVDHEKDKQLEGLSRELCSVESASYKTWFPRFWRRTTDRSRNIASFTDIGIATFLGLKSTVSHLLHSGTHVDDSCGDFGFPLYVAAWKGDKSMCKLLLENGADINKTNGRHGNALYAALTNKRNDLVFLLLQCNANVHQRGGMYGTILQAAAARGDDEVVRALIDRNANVNATCTLTEGFWPDALTAATWNSHETTARMLIEEGAQLIHTEYGSPLYGACFNNHENLISLYLEKGGNEIINNRGGEFGYPLQAAAWLGSFKTVRLLLDHGANVNAEGGYFGTALQAASYRGDEKIVRLLLQYGAQQLEGGEFGSSFQAACRNEQFNIQMILKEVTEKNESRS